MIVDEDEGNPNRGIVSCNPQSPLKIRRIVCSEKLKALEVTPFWRDLFLQFPC